MDLVDLEHVVFNVKVLFERLVLWKSSNPLLNVCKALSDVDHLRWAGLWTRFYLPALPADVEKPQAPWRIPVRVLQLGSASTKTWTASEQTRQPPPHLSQETAAICNYREHHDRRHIRTTFSQQSHPFLEFLQENITGLAACRAHCHYVAFNCALLTLSDQGTGLV